MLIDGYQRQFAYVRLSITDACNFKCNYCLPDGYDRSGTKTNGKCSTPEGELTTAEIQRLVRALAAEGVSKSGSLVEYGLAQRPHCNHTNHCADAWHPRNRLNDQWFNLKQNIKAWQLAGLTQLNVSIDSLIPEQF